MCECARVGHESSAAAAASGSQRRPGHTEQLAARLHNHDAAAVVHRQRLVELVAEQGLMLKRHVACGHRLEHQSVQCRGQQARRRATSQPVHRPRALSLSLPPSHRPGRRSCRAAGPRRCSWAPAGGRMQGAQEALAGAWDSRLGRQVLLAATGSLEREPNTRKAWQLQRTSYHSSSRPPSFSRCTMSRVVPPLRRPPCMGGPGRQRGHRASTGESAGAHTASPATAVWPSHLLPGVDKRAQAHVRDGARALGRDVAQHVGDHAQRQVPRLHAPLAHQPAGMASWVGGWVDCWPGETDKSACGSRQRRPLTHGQQASSSGGSSSHSLDKRGRRPRPAVDHSLHQAVGRQHVAACRARGERGRRWSAVRQVLAAHKRRALGGSAAALTAPRPA